MQRAVIIGTGACLPQRVMANAELEGMIDTSHAWIVERTGIEQRHIAAKGELTSDLAYEAGKQAISMAGISPESVDLLILATTTPDDTMPATATKVQHRLGITGGAAFDINAACSGFVYAMSIAQSFIAAGQAKRVLVIGAETYSRILDWSDRGTCILFGDGAAAVLLEATTQPGTSADRGILWSKIYSSGQYTDWLKTSGGVSSTQTAGVLSMAGKEIFRNAVTKMPEAVSEAVEAVGLTISDIDWLVPHQANMRILQGVAQKLQMGEERIVSTVARHANTSAASIPLALHLASQDGRIRRGQLIACPALGAGLTWGCTLLRW
jgi:3-oxoacyl-[acyl-carrier-protein] synthase-3